MDVEAYGGTAGLDGLLREVRRQASRADGPDAREVMDRLHRHTGADFALVAADGDTVDSSTAGFPQETLRSLAPLLARMSGGQLAAAATQADGWNVRCEVLGMHDSRPVLVAAARSVPSPEAVALISHTGSVITLLRRATDGDRTWRGFQYKARQVRFGVLSALLVARPVPARRMTTGAVPPLLEADRLRVHLLHCLTADRDRIVRASQDPSGYHGPDLLVHCPIFKEHVICLIADDTGSRKGDGSGGHPGGWAKSCAAWCGTTLVTRWVSAIRIRSAPQPRHTDRLPMPWPPPGPPPVAWSLIRSRPRWARSCPAGPLSPGPVRSCGRWTPFRRPPSTSPAS